MEKLGQGIIRTRLIDGGKAELIRVSTDKYQISINITVNDKDVANERMTHILSKIHDLEKEDRGF